MNFFLAPDAPVPDSPSHASPAPLSRPQKDVAPIAHPILPADGEQRSGEISRANGVGQFLDIYDDVVAVADCLEAILRWHGDNLPAGGQHPFRTWLRDQEEELRAIAADIADICNDLIPGAPAARDYHFVAYLEPFEPPPLPGGSDQTKPVSKTLTAVTPEWMGSRRTQEFFPGHTKQ
jgi:hypothetical protein